MRKIREALRLRFACGCSQRDIGAALALSKGSVSDYLARAARAGLTWETAQTMSDAEVERRLFAHAGRNEPPARVAIDLAWVHRELHRPGVTLQQLWAEYRAAAAARGDAARAYHYSQFCDHYAAFRAALTPTMRQVHRAGEKAFVDYSGQRPALVDPATGVVTPVELFVMVLGASNYTFVEATRTQQLPDFVASTVRAFEFFGGVPAILVPDQLRSAVTRPDRYDPEVNPTYAEMAAHYGVAVVPARPRKPRDKAKVEGAVLLAQRWILACLRDVRFFDLDALNVAIAALRDRLNDRPFQKLEGCRRSAFEALDRPALRPLPATRYELATWSHARVNVDYCVEHDRRLYSVPHTLVGAPVEVRATATTIEVLRAGARVAVHRRATGPAGTATIVEAHRPKSHRDYGAWPPARLVAWATAIGPAVGAVVEQILASKPHPEQGYRSCLALTRTAKKYGPERTEAACRRALAIGAPTRKSVELILARGLDRVALPDDAAPPPVVAHANIRGGDYFDKEET